MSSRFRWCCLLVLASTVRLEAARAGEGVAAFAMGVGEFRQLSPKDQETLLVKAFERRLEQARNIRYEAVLTGANHEYHDREVGKLVVRLNGSRLRHWKLDDSFRMDTIRGGDMSVESLPVETVASGHDSRSGVNTSTVQFSNTQRRFGRIDVAPDPINESNRYAYWLNGKHSPEQEYLIQYLIEHRSEFDISTSEMGETIRLTVPWQPFWSETAIGTRSFEIDPSRGFLPVRGKARWEIREQDGSLSWRDEVFSVDDARLAGDVFMPTKYVELISASTLGDGLVTVWQTDVSEIVAGDVTQEDLVVPLTAGMEVVDAIGEGKPGHSGRANRDIRDFRR